MVVLKLWRIFIEVLDWVSLPAVFWIFCHVCSFYQFCGEFFVVYLCMYVEVGMWWMSQIRSIQFKMVEFLSFWEVFLGAKMELLRMLLDVSMEIFNIFLMPLLVSLYLISLWSYGWFFEIFLVVVLWDLLLLSL